MNRTTQIRVFLSQNRLEAAFPLFEAALKHAPEDLKRRWIDLRGQARLAETEYQQNRISFDEYSAARKRTHQGLLALLSDWEEQGPARSGLHLAWYLVPVLVFAAAAWCLFSGKSAQPVAAPPAVLQAPAARPGAEVSPETNKPERPAQQPVRPIAPPPQVAPTVRLVLVHNTYCKDEPVWVDGQPARLLEPGMSRTTIEVRADTFHSFKMGNWAVQGLYIGAADAGREILVNCH
ncbi:MAG: hypothetical protein IT260_05065 [Saprospiraceae bacterium]|nr:hypothetical protein [Saprospiraceae bacterium]